MVFYNFLNECKQHPPELYDILKEFYVFYLHLKKSLPYNSLYICGFVCTYFCGFTCMHICGEKVSFWRDFPRAIQSTLFFEAESLSWPGAHQADSDGLPVSLRDLSDSCWDYKIIPYVGPGN